MAFISRHDTPTMAEWPKSQFGSAIPVTMKQEMYIPTHVFMAPPKVFQADKSDCRLSVEASSSRSPSHDSIMSQSYPPSAYSPPPNDSGSYPSPPEKTAKQGVLFGTGDRVYHPPVGGSDPEKFASGDYGRSPGRYSRTHSSQDYSNRNTRHGHGHHVSLEDKALGLLFYLSFPCFLVSIGVMLWAVVSLLIAIILLPVRLLTRSETTRLSNLLLPLLRLQLRLIYSDSHSATSLVSAPTSSLLVVHIFSPVVSMGVLISALTAGGFWFFSAILGDPTGKDNRNDGRESVLGVRAWWERWLLKGLQ